MQNLETPTMVDVLALPQLELFTRITAASLRTVANMIHNLADSLAEEVKVEEREEGEDGKDDNLDGIESETIEEKLSRLRCDTVTSVDSGIEVEVEEVLLDTSDSDADVEDSAEEDERTDPCTGLRVISLDEVADHCTMEDGWMVVYDRVYEVTEVLRRHPGGEEVMAEYLGYDATMAFRGVGHSKAATRMLQPCLIGILPANERLNFYS